MGGVEPRLLFWPLFFGLPYNTTCIELLTELRMVEEFSKKNDRTFASSIFEGFFSFLVWVVTKLPAI